MGVSGEYTALKHDSSYIELRPLPTIGAIWLRVRALHMKFALRASYVPLLSVQCLSTSLSGGTSGSGSQGSLSDT